jgi:hypothetical protein
MADENRQNRQIESQKNPGSTGRRRPIVAKVRQVENQRRIAVAPDEKQVAEWRAQMKEIFATASPLFVQASIQQLIEVSKLPGECVANTISLSAALELIASRSPKTRFKRH